MNENWRKFGILTGLIFIGLFVIQGFFSLGAALGQPVNSPGYLLAGAVEIYAIVAAYNHFAKKKV